MEEQNNFNMALRKLINEERTFIADFRSKLNKICDQFNEHLDETELRISKEGKSKPRIIDEENDENENG